MISPDLPITKSDEDILNRGSFAKSLAQALLQYSHSSSFTIGLYGEWGSGKTSLLNMVLETVEEADNNAVVLRFNPWLCSDPKQLIIQFFKQLSAAIRLKQSAKDQAWLLIDQYADIFDAASLIPGVGTLLAAAGKALASEAQKQTERQTNDLQENKDKIIAKMVEENLKIVVSIDDIDRLSEGEIIAVFQLVKALADFPNTVYLLAFDYDVVVHALGKVQHGDGKAYLEKVIQVPFEIPAPNMTSIHNTLFSKLEAILGNIPEDKWDRVTWAELFQYGIKEYVKSIRDVIRYTNVFSLKYELLKGETDPVDLLGLTCLQVFEPAIYSKLPNCKDILCGTVEGYPYEKQKAIEEEVEKTINGLVPDSVNTDAIKNILGILFPKTRTNKNKLHIMGRIYTRRRFLINNNISASECFDRYFSLMLEKDAIPTANIKQLIFEMNELDLANGIKQIYEDGKIIRLLDEIEAYANKGDTATISAERASLIIISLARQWSSFKVEENGFYSIPFDWRFIFCVVDPLLKSMNASSRYPCIRTLFEDAEVQLPTLALLLDTFETKHGRFTEKDPTDGEQIITLDEVLELEKIFTKRAIDALDSRDALKEHGGLNFLWMLEKIDAEIVTSRKSSLVADDISLISVLGCCASHGRAAARIVVKTRGINLKAVEKFIDISEAHQRVAAFVTTNKFLTLSEDSQMDVVTFLLTVEKGSVEVESAFPTNISEDVIRKELRKLLDDIHPDN